MHGGFLKASCRGELTSMSPGKASLIRCQMCLSIAQLLLSATPLFVLESRKATEDAVDHRTWDEIRQTRRINTRVSQLSDFVRGCSPVI